jgi:hypothetical protein
VPEARDDRRDLVERSLAEEIARLRREHLRLLVDARAAHDSAEQAAAELRRRAAEDRSAAEADRARLESDLSSSTDRGDALAAELADVHASRSWRLTEGARRASEMLRRRP